MGVTVSVPVIRPLSTVTLSGFHYKCCLHSHLVTLLEGEQAPGWPFDNRGQDFFSLSHFPIALPSYNYDIFSPLAAMKASQAFKLHWTTPTPIVLNTIGNGFTHFFYTLRGKI